MEAYHNWHIDALAGELPIGDCCKKLIGRFLSGDLNNIETFKPRYTDSFCSRKDIEDLLCKQMLRDDAIDLCLNVYKEKILHKEPPPPVECYFVSVHAQKFTEYIEKDIGYMDKFIDMTGEDLTNENARLFVVIYSPSHWSLLVLDFRAHHFISYDSNPDNTSPNAETRLWAHLLRRYFVEGHHLQDLRDWPLVHAESPKQCASLDCGLFVLKYIDCLVYNQPFQITQADMEHLRLIYAATLIAESVNEEDTHLCYYQCSVKRLYSQAPTLPGEGDGQSSGAKVSTTVAATGNLQSHQGKKKREEEMDPIFWKNAEKISANMMKCKLCYEKIKVKSVTRMIYHWLGPGFGVSGCEKVTAEVRAYVTKWKCQKDDKYEKVCKYCGTTTTSQLKLSYHWSGISCPGVKPCEKINVADRKAAVEEIEKLEGGKGKRRCSSPNPEGRRACKRQSSQMDPDNGMNPVVVQGSGGNAMATDVPAVHDDLGTSLPSTSSPAHDRQYLQPPPVSALAINNALLGRPSTDMPDMAHHDPNSERTSSALAIVSRNEIHTMRQNQAHEHANTQGDSIIHNGLAVLDQPSTHLSSKIRVRDGPNLHSINILPHDGHEMDTHTQLRTEDAVQSTVKGAVQKWSFLTGLPSSYLWTGESCQLYDVIATHGSSPRCMLPLISSSNKHVAGRINDKLRHEIDEYVKMVKSSWSSTKCTICIKDFKIPSQDIHIFAAMARSHMSTIFMKYDLVPLPKNANQCKVRAATAKRFLRSIIAEVGLHNMSHIIIPYNMSFLHNNCQCIVLVDAAYHLAKAYINLYSNVFGILFLEYAVFTDSVFRCNFDGLPTNIASTGHINLLSAMLERKQEIRFLQNDVCKFISGLAFWKSELAYNDMRRSTESMLQVAQKEEDFIFPKYSDILEKVDKREEVCNLMVKIITTDNILSCSKFWTSIEAYMDLYNRIQKMIYYVRNDNFTLADYFSTYADTRRGILKEDFCHNDYAKILEGVDLLLPRDEFIYSVACYLCPQIRYLKDDVCELEHIISKLPEMMEGDNARKEKLIEELRAYHAKNSAYIKDEAWSVEHMMTHSNVWWEKWGIGVPELKELATKILNTLCSNNHNWRIMHDMYLSMPENSQGQKLLDLLYVRLNNNFKYDATEGQEEGLALNGPKTVVGPMEFNDLFHKYFTNDVY